MKLLFVSGTAMTGRKVLHCSALAAPTKATNRNMTEISHCTTTLQRNGWNCLCLNRFLNKSSSTQQDNSVHCFHPASARIGVGPCVHVQNVSYNVMAPPACSCRKVRFKIFVEFRVACSHIFKHIQSPKRMPPSNLQGLNGISSHASKPHARTQWKEKESKTLD